METFSNIQASLVAPKRRDALLILNQFVTTPQLIIIKTLRRKLGRGPAWPSPSTMELVRHHCRTWRWSLTCQDFRSRSTGLSRSRRSNYVYHDSMSCPRVLSHGRVRNVPAIIFGRKSSFWGDFVSEPNRYREGEDTLSIRDLQRVKAGTLGS